MPHLFRSLVPALPLAALLSGCALQTSAVDPPLTVDAGVQGKLMGGQQPVTGSSIYLIQFGNTGYGVPNSTSIIASTTSDANGNFTLPSHTCTSSSLETLIEARGGNPGLAAGTNNSAIFLAAYTGPCGNLSASTFINIDEVTTVAAAYTLRPFVSGNNVGVSSTNSQGAGNAYLMYNNLVTNATGSSPGAYVPAGMAVPTATINALANSLAACVNTAGPTSTSCANLFSYSGVAGTGATANTFNIAVAIASNPATHAADIFNNAGSSTPFQPALTQAPNDWTLPVVYTGGYLSSPQTALDIDSTGDVLVATQGGLNGTIEAIGFNNTLLFTGLLNGTIDDPTSLAFDQGGNLIIGNSASGDASVMKYNFSATVFKKTSSQIVNPSRLAIDRSGNIIVSDAETQHSATQNQYVLSLSDTDGTVQTSVTINQSDLYGPWVGVANNGDVFISTNSALGTGIYTAALNSGSFSTTCFCNGFVALNAASTAYIAYGAGRVNSFPSPYNAASASASFSNAGNGSLTDMSVDGLGNIWLASSGTTPPSTSPSVVEVTPDLTVSQYGYSEFGASTSISLLPSSSTLSVSALAIDGSGNVWLANSLSGGLYELVGAAAPVTTPRSIAALNQVEGTRP